eukprot:gene11098-7896_t
MWWQYIFSCGRPADISRQGPVRRPTASIRGNLVRSYNTNIEDDFYLDREHELGKGGCGVVVVGEQKQTRGQYAIKIINKSTAERGRLDRELKLMKDVDHANIVRLFSVYDSPTHMYFVMELCLGGHLGNLLSRQPNKCVDEEWAKRLCRQLLSAVAHIHSRGIAHRDIKLQNILIDSTIDRHAQLKLIDFGYGSRFIGALPMKTKCGTPYTTAPEVIREHYDQRCDVWSCGVVLYIMLCGRRPFEAIDVGGPLSDAGKAAMITNILAGRYHFNHKQWQQVSRQAVNFVKALLNPDYRHRLHSHEALDSPWLKDSQVLANQSKMLATEKGARAVNKLKQTTDHNDFQRAGMVALVFGIPSRAATDLRAVFQSFDVDNSGGLSRKEFHGALGRLAPELSHEDVERLFDIVDIDKNQQISYTEFLVATLDPRDVDIEELNKAFRLLDEDGNGFITRDEMRKVVKQMLQQQLENSNEKASDLLQLSSRPLSNTGDYLDDLVEQRLETIFAQVDKDNDGTISHSEFVWAMTGMDPALFADGSQPKAMTRSSRSDSGLAAAPALGKVSSGYFHTSDRFSRRPNADSSVRGFGGLSFKGSNTFAATDADSQAGSMRRASSSGPPAAAPPPRQASLRNLPRQSFRGTRTIVEESSAVTGSSGRVSSLRPLRADSTDANDAPAALSGRGESRRRLSVGAPAAEATATVDARLVAPAAAAAAAAADEAQAFGEDEDDLSRASLGSPLPQYKGMLARSQKAVLDDDAERSPRPASLRLETLRGNSGSLAMAPVSDDLHVPDALRAASTDADDAPSSRDEQSSTSSFGAQAVAQLFGPGAPLSGRRLPPLSTAPPPTTQPPQQLAPPQQQALRSVKETQVYFTSPEEASHSDADGRRSSIASTSSRPAPQGLLAASRSGVGDDICALDEPSACELPGPLGGFAPAHASARSSRSSSQRQPGEAVPPYRYDLDPLAPASPPGPMGTPKLARLGSKFAGSFKRDVSSKYLAADNSDGEALAHYEERADAEPVPPPLSRLGSRGVSFSARSQRDLDSTSSTDMSVPMASPSFLANLKRMVSSSHNGPAAAHA